MNLSTFAQFDKAHVILTTVFMDLYFLENCSNKSIEGIIISAVWNSSQKLKYPISLIK